MCKYHQVSQTSYFTKNKLCSIALSGGRITLTGNSYIYTKDSVVIKKKIADGAEFEKMLAEYFGIDTSEMKHGV